MDDRTFLPIMGKIEQLGYFQDFLRPVLARNTLKD